MLVCVRPGKKQQCSVFLQGSSYLDALIFSGCRPGCVTASEVGELYGGKERQDSTLSGTENIDTTRNTT